MICALPLRFPNRSATGGVWRSNSLAGGTVPAPADLKKGIDTMKYLFITDDHEVAGFVTRYGVQRVFVDLEIHGKVERQGGKDTVISRHRRENIRQVKEHCNGAECLVRVNPLHAESRSEVDYCIDSGADLLMLPMFRSAKELNHFCQLVNNRVPVVPLVETAGAMRDLRELLKLEGIREIHVGLNDLHLDLGLSFLFELVANGTLDRIAETCHQAHTRLGIGGVGIVGPGNLIPGEMVLGEYVRLGAHATILSRAFHHRATSLPDLKSKVDFPAEISKLNDAEARLRKRLPEQVEADRREFQRRIFDICAAKKAA